MNPLDDLFASRPPTPERPLLGLTVLVVEDSRFACEALRLMCLKSGARLRRAGSLFHARRHLATYRPGAVIVDIGLPDGDGAQLIAEIAKARPRVGAIIATSGDVGEEDRAMEAGADCFLGKPIASLTAFQNAILEQLPPERHPMGLRIVDDESIDPDPIALHDDLAHIAGILKERADLAEIDYAAHFLTGVARISGDDSLGEAAAALAATRARGDEVADDLARLGGLLKDRLTKLPAGNVMHG